VFGESGASIRRVMICGRTVFADGRLLTLDEPALRRQAEAAAARLDQANAPSKAAADAVAAFVGTFCMALGCQGHPVRRTLACTPAG
jgi:5-methylthioadenosine/S-adenosylhomocysteine deaminase